MPNGRRRQSNTRHANRQRHLQSVRAEAVVDEAPPVVIQAEAVPTEERLSEQEVQEALLDIDRIYQEELEEKDREYSREITKWKSMNDTKTKQINKLDDEKRTTQRVAKKFMDKYEKAKEGTLLGFQEVEIEDQEKEINDLTYMLDKAIDKVKQMKEQQENLMKAGEKAFFLYHLVKNTDHSEGAIIHLGSGKMVKVLTDEEAEDVRQNATQERRMNSEEIAQMMGNLTGQ